MGPTPLFSRSKVLNITIVVEGLILLTATIWTYLSGPEADRYLHLAHYAGVAWRGPAAKW